MKIRRNPRSGFTLLETLVALAIASLCVMMILLASIQLQTRESDALARTRLTEFALGVLETYRVLGPKMGPGGERLGGWVWSLVATPRHDENGDAKTLGIAYLDVDVTVFNRERPEFRVTLSEIVARRLSDAAP
ncbi:type II secretion system protein [Stagnihabitans tardus]|uniref:Prepilin-type N-terminal cleavage/methylation domain-containing protein n=1 Tax=Stagnihabitans tardus TaxID=2699202 RepID=A0AAE4YCA2_9RHOB|nr:type II secretion system protein [Stagnihabitans tardus]NBZ90072.1 prepilin-type N-terminal cleavage/methylation domain-containing protein [Stagnihabitans tardus]